jgi:hypothetical protein
MPGAADRLLRALYREYVGADSGDGTVRWMVDRLAKLDQLKRRPEANLRACALRPRRRREEVMQHR